MFSCVTASGLKPVDTPLYDSHRLVYQLLVNLVTDSPDAHFNAVRGTRQVLGCAMCLRLSREDPMCYAAQSYERALAIMLWM
jgi:hypothetical protein